MFSSAIAYAGSDSEGSVLNWIVQNIVFLLAGLVVIGVIYALSTLVQALIGKQKKMINEAHGISEEDVQESESIFKKMYDKAWSLVPMDKESDIDLGHDYDGIRELDNRLPPWWIYLFYFTIIWGVGYLYVTEISDNRISQTEEYELVMEKAEIEKRAWLASQPEAVNETNVQFLDDPEEIGYGEETFIVSCAVCHGKLGEGGIGPNLTDKYWLHGGSIGDVFASISHGIPDKGMIAWNTTLSASSIQQVSSYILTLVGTNPPNAKEAQGDLMEY